ncbi:hypothetical protein L218DRAFT_999841 [Marasmius fiardii PR-910]|nr:hypothetical protein L218DRAFT_999841 [Marasmius fiardii PR-910]
MSYHQLDHDVLNHIKDCHKELSFTNVWPNLQRINVLSKTIGAICTNVRGGLKTKRQKKQGLEDFTQAMVSGYLVAGGQTAQRRFAKKNEGVKWVEEGDEQDPEGQPDTDMPGGLPSKRARVESDVATKAGSGRKKKGKDFWAIFEEYFKEKMDKEGLGKKISDQAWKA